MNALTILAPAGELVSLSDDLDLARDLVCEELAASTRVALPLMPRKTDGSAPYCRKR